MPKRAQEKVKKAPRNPQLFVEGDNPISFYLIDHEDRRNISVHFRPLPEKRVSTLTKLIQRHGGVVHDNIDESRVIIVNEEAVEGYSRFYRFIPRVDVEPPGFISKCINNNDYRHWRPIPQAMGGRPRNPARPPQERRGFTDQEDQFLAEYIALRIPDKNAGGRMGNKIYQELEEHATEFDTGRYIMGRNHTWHSWRERYKKDPERFDEMIDEILARDDRPVDDKVVYPMNRRLSSRHLVAQTRLDKPDAEAEESETDEDGLESDEQPRGRKRRLRYSRDTTYEPPQKRARADEEEEEEEDDFVAAAAVASERNVAHRSNAQYRDENGAGPSGTQRTPSRSPSPPPHADEQPLDQAKESAVAIKQRPKPRPLKSNQDIIPNTQSTLVEPTQRSPKKRASVLQGREPFEHQSGGEENLDSDSEAQPIQQNQQSSASRSNVHSTPRKLVEVLVPRIQDLRRSSASQANEGHQSSVPPIATLTRSSPENEAGDGATEDEMDQLDQSSIASGTPPYVGTYEDSDTPQEDDTIVDEGPSGQRHEEEKEMVEGVEGTVEDEESGAGSDDEIDYLLYEEKGSESESDLKAERNLRNAELDGAIPPPPPPPVPRRSGRNRK